MEFGEEQGLVTNYEVMKHLQQVKSRIKKHKDLQNLRTIEFETTQYLGDIDEERTMTLIKMFQPNANIETEEKDYFDKLTKFEKFQIINLLPTTIVELFLIIEECDERFDSDQLQKLLEFIQ